MSSYRKYEHTDRMWRRTDLDAGQVAICSCDPDIFLVGHCFIEAIAIILRKLRSHPEKEILVKNGGGGLPSERMTKGY